MVNHIQYKVPYTHVNCKPSTDNKSKINAKKQLVIPTYLIYEIKIIWRGLSGFEVEKNPGLGIR